MLTQCKKEVIAEPEIDVLGVIQNINLLRHSGCNCGDEYMPPVPDLSSDNQLEKAAMAHADDMARRKYLGHLSPEGSTPAERVLKTGYNGVFIAENIARGYTQVDQLVAGWKSSVSHCKAMMDGKSEEAGVAMVDNYWVIVFGRQVQSR